MSFERLEPGTAEWTAYLRRVAELPVPGGCLVASTPNATVTLAERGKWQPHERESRASEFLSLIESAGFGSIRLFAQRLSPLGALRRDVHGEINRLRSNPLMRLGFWLQRRFRGLVPAPPLPDSRSTSRFNRWRRPPASARDWMDRSC